MKLFISLLLYSVFSQASVSHKWHDQFVEPLNFKKFNINQVASQIHNGLVVILAEEHDSKLDHINQIRILKEVANIGLVDSISVAMEFFDYTKQKIVDSFVHGELAEQDFLKQVGWGGNDFNMYRKQVLFPGLNKGRTYAINLPRSISAKISKLGVDALTQAERALLPSDFELGNDLYRKRFYNIMSGGGHTISEEKLARYFAAQSAWDDTMANQIVNALSENSSQVIFVIVGKFHAEFGGGLPDRLKARGVENVLNITQFNASESSVKDMYNYIRPHTEFGKVSDLIWIQGEPTLE